MGEIDQGNIRIQTWAGGATVRMVDCTNAGKRGKVCLELSIGINDRDPQKVCDIIYNLGIKLDQVSDWETAIKFAELAKETGYVGVAQYELKAIRVPPIGFKQVLLENENFYAVFDFENFSIADRRDQANCPRFIPSHNQKKADFKKAYAFAKSLEGKIPETLTFDQFTSMLCDEAGVRGHYYCAMD